MTTVNDTTSRHAPTSAPLLQPLIERWSPRSYDAQAKIEPTVINTILEAARWAPSASNIQPWRFLVAERGTEAFASVRESLVSFNQIWAESAAALIVNIAVVTDDEGGTNRWAAYDLGQAVAHLTVQAQHEGLHTHQIGGFDHDALHKTLKLTPNLEVLSVTAIGARAEADALPEGPLRERESAPRTRLELNEILVNA